MSYSDLVSQHQRLSVLRLLAEAPEYSANTSVIQDALDAFGLAASRDQVESLVAWLGEQSLVRVERFGSATVVHVLPRGIDVSAGRATVPGIKRPSPGA